jgi:hypothetical protein
VGSYAYRIGSSDAENITFSDSVTVEAMGGTQDPGMPKALTLTAVSPNPVRGILTVRFGVPSATTVDFAIHDLTGRRLAKEEVFCENAGWLSRQWDVTSHNGEMLPGGIYVFSLTTMGASVSSPLVVLR